MTKGAKFSVIRSTGDLIVFEVFTRRLLSAGELDVVEKVLPTFTKAKNFLSKNFPNSSFGHKVFIRPRPFIGPIRPFEVEAANKGFRWQDHATKIKHQHNKRND